MALLTKADQEYLYYAGAGPGEDVRQEIANYYDMDSGLTLDDVKTAYFELGLEQEEEDV